MTTHSDPVLTADDEAFLQRVTSQPEQGRSPSVEPDMSTAVSQGEDSQQPTLNENAQDIPLPASPIEKFGEELGEEERKARARAETAEILSEPAKQEPNVTSEKKKKRWSSMFWKKTGDIERVRNRLRRASRCPGCKDLAGMLTSVMYRTKDQPRQTSHDLKVQPWHRVQQPQIMERKRKLKRQT